MLLITGATGTTGRGVVRLLTDRGVAFRAMSRTPTGDQVHGDYTDPASLDRAMEGVDALFLLCPGTADLPAHESAVLDAAKRAGVPRVVKLSAIPVGPIARWHGPGEEATRAFPAWTLLRPGMFASNSLQWAPQIAAGEPVPNAMGAARLGVVDPRDLAEVAVRALLDDGHHGRTHTLTGPELLSVPEQVAVLSGVLGRTLSTVDVSPDVLPPEYAEGARAVRNGEGSLLSDDVADVLGRPATPYATWARECYPRP